ncbi:hypothetical protein BDB00DRAFT_871054 [Zychaea mexicana]|uniref:uncharacterized protein n=1 Tax=Zychaea mexicana TaxID=64656 RepID=UPI0022FDC48E|nr:uncharacterized protein BDB00DRAFT_871054 [Zychaea mexicana]KAI9494776.1 hypothetical protein BDB00DRAFT_871054 [Zychaea mexicana]
METEQEEAQQHYLVMNNTSDNNNNIATTYQNATNQQSWADQMEQLSVPQEEYDTNRYDHLHPNTPEFVRDLHKRMDETNKMVAQLAEALAENTKLVRENMNLAQELQAAKNQIAQLQQHQQHLLRILTKEDSTDKPTGSIASKYATTATTRVRN